MSRRNTYQRARYANLNRVIREAAERGEGIAGVQKAFYTARLPKDPEAIARLAAECWECGGLGHGHRDCPNVECFDCGEIGHRRRDCPQRAK